MTKHIFKDICFYLFSSSSSFFFFLTGMHKKSAGTIRKAESEEKLAGLWGSDRLKEGSSPRQAGPQRGLEEGSPVSSVEDVVIDLSSSTRQETDRAQQGVGAQGRPDSEGLEGLQPGKEGAL